MPFLKYILVLLLLSSPCLAGEAAPAATPAPPASPTPAPVRPAGEFQLPVPEGMPVTGIKVPHYDAEGNLLMVFEAASAQRTADDKIEIEDLNLEAMDEEGRKVVVQMPRSTFNLDSKVVTGDKTASISREDLRVTADELDFDTNTRFVKMRGNITMVISTEQTFE